MVPKIDREDKLFDKQIADRINIKIEDWIGRIFRTDRSEE